MRSRFAGEGPVIDEGLVIRTDNRSLITDYQLFYKIVRKEK
jgi:hypothetical protein